ncbi:unnamed protein product [Bursaphelenchus xylophilus]|uniref:(pine wood nematode) hypothetical protein n=1 Tax=Bursaphelenchus xylophilus TaxID=6326 RepID=A0A7I8X9M8_BURXY|nr:unnamed protein product [Bursaphelenchus xylophilus]CAG9119259.1 unnamed protein product [Bursaphelenchus xylophilus]
MEQCNMYPKSIKGFQKVQTSSKDQKNYMYRRLCGPIWTGYDFFIEKACMKCLRVLAKKWDNRRTLGEGSAET